MLSLFGAPALSQFRLDKLLQLLRARDPRVCAVKLTRNFGSHGACLAGFAQARGDHALTVAERTVAAEVR